MKIKHSINIARQISSQRNFRENLAILNQLKPSERKLLKPLFSIVFCICWLIYSTTLKKIPIEHKKNLLLENRKKILTTNGKRAQNILILEPDRLIRSWKKYKAIRYNLNLALRNRLVTKNLIYTEIFFHLEKVLLHTKNKWVLCEKFSEIKIQNVLGVSVFDDKNNLVATSAGYFTHDIFTIEYLISIPGPNSLTARWIIHEAILDYVHATGYKYVRISNYSRTSLENLKFNHMLGYRDYNLL